MANGRSDSGRTPVLSGVVRVSLGAVLISFSAVFVKLAHVSATMAGFYRTAFGGLLLLIILALKGQRPWKSAPALGLGLIAGVIFALDLFVWHKSIHNVGPGLATILANFQVFLLAIYGFAVLGERPRPQVVLAIPLAILGLFLLAGIGWSQLERIYRLGLWFGLAAAVCYAAYILVLRRLQSLTGNPGAMANLAVISLVSAGLLALAARQTNDSFAIPDLQSLWALAGYGAISQVLGWVLISTGLPRIRSSLAGLVILLQPSLSFVWDIVFFQRPTDVWGGIGAALTLAAIYMGATAKPARNR
jgi:drug/metabolite transporter (DMT)-like permease